MKNVSMIKKFDREAGQGALEYLGAVVVAVTIVALLITAANGWGGQLVGVMGTAISKISFGG